VANLKGILSPNLENNLDEMNDNAVNNMPVPTPSVWDYAKTRASNSFMFGTSVALSTWAQQGNSPRYDEAQLRNLYPDTPDNYWKGGANAVQAEFLYDRFKNEQEAQTQRTLIAGSSDPNPTSDTALGILGFGASVVGDLADPITPLSFALGAGMTRVAGGLVGRAAPAFMEAISSSKYIRGGATLGGEIINNIGATLGAEVGIKYPLNQAILNEYEKKDRTLYDTTVSSIGSAVVMGVLGHYGGKLFKSAFGKDSSPAPEFAEKMRNESFYKTKDQANALLGSPSAHEANFNEAATRTFTESASPSRTSNTEVMAMKAFNKSKVPEFQTASPFYGVYEKNSGKLDYAGERYGDTHVFMSSPEAAQGMLDNYATKNPYGVYGHKGGLNLLDLNNTPANDHVDVLDIIENELGATFFNKIPDNASLADVFKSVMDSEGHEGLSGNDIVSMFNKINKSLEGQGFQGTLHKETLGDTAHDVMSIFDSAMNEKDMAKMFEGITSSPDTSVMEDPIIPRAQADIVTADGKIIKAEQELSHDVFYDNDPEFKKEYDKFNDPEYLAKVQETMNSDPADLKIEDVAKDISSDLKESINQVSQKLGTENTELDPMMKHYGELEEQVKEVQKEIKNNTPEKENEIVKAMENCLRKH